MIGEIKKTCEPFCAKFSLLMNPTLKLIIPSNNILSGFSVLLVLHLSNFLFFIFFVNSYFSKLYFQAVQRVKEERDMAVKQKQLLQQELVSIELLLVLASLSYFVIMLW